VKAPVVPGHESSARLWSWARAPREFGLKLGEKSSPSRSTLRPLPLLPQRKYWMCEIHDMYGFQKQCNGGWAEYMRPAPNSRIHKMPSDIRREDGVLVEPLACAIHAVERGRHPTRRHRGAGRGPAPWAC